MQNTICNAILSIVATKDVKFVSSKIKSLEELITLNEVEKQIIKDIKESLFVDQVVSTSFIKEKYAYYVEADENIIESPLSKDAIDSAIIDIHIRQLKSNLAKNVLSLGSEINNLSPEEIKQKFSALYQSTILEAKKAAAENAIAKKEKPYEELVASSDGLTLVLPQIEQYAGKATPGSLVAILAFTGSYKSTYAINVAYQNAMQGKNMLYISLEDPTPKLVNRFVLNYIAETVETKDQLINANWVRDAQLTKEQSEFYNHKHNEFVDTLQDRLILWGQSDIKYNSFMDVAEVFRMANKKFLNDTGRPVDGIIIDQLALLKYETGSNKNYSYDGAALNDWVSFFRKQALDFLDEGHQVTMFIVSQISRQAHAEASREKNLGRYSASCTADSHELERAASTMVTFYKDSKTPNATIVNIPKARNGEIPQMPFAEPVYGEYYHIGPLKFSSNPITSETFDNEEINFEDLIS